MQIVRVKKSQNYSMYKYMYIQKLLGSCLVKVYTVYYNSPYKTPTYNNKWNCP